MKILNNNCWTVTAKKAGKGEPFHFKPLWVGHWDSLSRLKWTTGITYKATHYLVPMKVQIFWLWFYIEVQLKGVKQSEMEMEVKQETREISQTITFPVKDWETAKVKIGHLNYQGTISLMDAVEVIKQLEEKNGYNIEKPEAEPGDQVQCKNCQWQGTERQLANAADLCPNCRSNAIISI